jgi:hypothetical protein
MKLWAALYIAIWIVFFEFLFGLWPAAPAVVPYAHLVLGVAIVLVTYYCFAELRKTKVPGRVKRVAQASWTLSLVGAVFGFLLWFHVGTGWVIPFISLTIFNGILLLHVVIALAVITQLAAVAIAYDMWEDHEFANETGPGEVPPAPTP